MKIMVNAQPHKVNSKILADILIELGFSHTAIATALNGVFIAAEKRTDTKLTAGDQLEVLVPMQGG